MRTARGRGKGPPESDGERLVCAGVRWALFLTIMFEMIVGGKSEISEGGVGRLSS